MTKRLCYCLFNCRYEDAFNRFVEEINCLAAYQWWEGSLHSILTVLAYPFSWSWQQWRRRKKVQRLREYVRSEYDHACLRSCRSRALYEGLKVAATPDLMLAYIDVFLGGDEKRPDLPPKLMQRLPMAMIFGGDGSYMAPYSLHSDNLLTSLLGQVSDHVCDFGYPVAIGLFPGSGMLKQRLHFLHDSGARPEKSYVFR
jgi:hypothetical protein